MLNVSEASANKKIVHFYENFDNNPGLDQEMKKAIKPYLLPLDHPMKAPLDLIFSESRALKNRETFINAGFNILFARPMSYICVAKHPLLPGYLLKVYLDNETRQKEDTPGWKWLANRCKAAEKIRKLIKKQKLEHFSVPDKWLYPVPVTENSQQPVILIVTEMNILNSRKTKKAWSETTEKQLDELYCILSHGYASTDLINNIPYTKEGKFTCIDTEYIKRNHKYRRIKPYLSEPMQVYWTELVNRKE